jgi:folate-binding protein YgfZ
MVSQGATNDPLTTSPSIPFTVMAVPLAMRTTLCFCRAHACAASEMHQSANAKRSGAWPGSAASNANVAPALAAMKTRARREAASVRVTLASLYLSSMPAELVADLSSNAVIAVSGDDAAAFLHAQFTNDVMALTPGSAQWNGWCTPKGRLLATFLLVRRAEGFLLLLPSELAAPIAKRLSMFVLRSKVQIKDVSGQYARRAILGTRPEPRPMHVLEQDGAITIALGDDRFIALTPPSTALAPNTSPDAWELASIHAGVPTITAATQEAFVPQMANFELVGGVSFKKGCYPGQEIVARMQYRGGLKRRMALAHVEGDERPAPGQSVYSSAFGDQSAGTIVNAAPAPDGGFDALVVAQIESIERGDLRWKSPDGPRVEVRSHPPLAAAS